MNSIAKRSQNINQLQRFVSICVYSWLSKYFQKTLNMQNEPNLNISLTYLTKEAKRTYSDFYQKEAKKTNPILTLS